MLRRLQNYIDQANLKYRAPEVFGLSVTILVLSLPAVRPLRHVAADSADRPRARAGLRFRRSTSAARASAGSRKFEEMLPDAIDLFNRSMKAGHNMHAGLETIAEETFDPVKNGVSQSHRGTRPRRAARRHAARTGQPRSAHRSQVLHHRTHPAAANRRGPGPGAARTLRCWCANASALPPK